jgi:hypothetical protein
MSTPEIPLVDTGRIRKQVASQYGVNLPDNDPILMSIALSMMTVREVITEERAKRADDNLLRYKDVRHVLEDVRNDSLQFSQEIVALALDQISKVVIAELAEERRTKAAIINKLKVWLAASFGFAVAAIML